MPKPRLIKPLKYTQDVLTGANPKERHLCKMPCRGGSRRLFGFWKPESAKACVVRVVDSYDVQDVFPEYETRGPKWNPRPAKRWAAN